MISTGIDQRSLQSVLGLPPHLMSLEDLQLLASNELARISNAMSNLRIVKTKAREPSPKQKEKFKQDSRLEALLALGGGMTIDELLKMKGGSDQ